MMKRSLISRLPYCLLLTAVSLIPSGCGKEAPASGGENEQHIRRVAILYGRFTGTHRGKTPANADEFKKFAKGVEAAADGAKLDATGVDALFVSPRDQLPYTVVYKPATAPSMDGTAPVIVYEQQGAGGKRLVAFSNGKVEQADEAKFKELVPGS